MPLFRGNRCLGVEVWILVVFAMTLALIAASVVQMLPDESAIASTLHIPVGFADTMPYTSLTSAAGQIPPTSTPPCVPTNATAEQLVAGSDAGTPLCPGHSIDVGLQVDQASLKQAPIATDNMLDSYSPEVKIAVAAAQSNPQPREPELDALLHNTPTASRSGAADANAPVAASVATTASL